MKNARHKTIGQSIYTVLIISLALLVATSIAYSKDSDKLFSAVTQGKIKDTELLIKGKNIDLNIHDKKGFSLLSIAVQHNHKEMVGFLIDNGAEIDLASKKDKRTPLSYAASANNDPIVKLLVRKGANINTSDLKGTTPLMYAKNNYSTASFLLENGADPDINDNDGWTALFYAATGGHVENITVVELLIQAGTAINLRDKSGWTALHYAVQYSETEMVSFLLENGADPNIINKDGNTPLFIAVINNNLPLSKLLVSHGTDRLVKNSNGQSALDIAKSKKLTAIIDFLESE